MLHNIYYKGTDYISSTFWRLLGTKRKDRQANYLKLLYDLKKSSSLFNKSVLYKRGRSYSCILWNSGETIARNLQVIYSTYLIKKKN